MMTRGPIERGGQMSRLQTRLTKWRANYSSSQGEATEVYVVEIEYTHTICRLTCPKRESTVSCLVMHLSHSATVTAQGLRLSPTLNLLCESQDRHLSLSQPKSNVHFLLNRARATVMDGEAAASPPIEELDTFGVLLPLPYRLAILIVLGVWLWGLNLHGLFLLKIVSERRQRRSKSVRSCQSRTSRF